MRDPKVFDAAVIGAGAAGLMTAIVCAEAGLSVVILDSKEKIGAKILMSGGTRCNVTNLKVTERDFESEKPVILRNVLRSFSSAETVRFFENLGVPLILEAGGKYFPSTHSGRTILEALLRKVQNQGVVLRPGCRVEAVEKQNGLFLSSGDGFSVVSKTVTLCTGGLSYPATGSDGKGYELAKACGHTLVPTSPSLTPLQGGDEAFHALSGLSVDCRLSLGKGSSKTAFEGPLLFTHSGYSGPVVLNISRYWIRQKPPRGDVFADFLPSEPEDLFMQALVKTSREKPQMPVKKILSAKFPDRFAESLMGYAGIPQTRSINQLSRTERQKLLDSLYRFPLKVTEAVGYAKAEVTAGGVNLEEIDFRTMESKKLPGLFFAGEVLDADGRIGGFNFQWAWSSGQTAGRGIAKKLKG